MIHHVLCIEAPLSTNHPTIDIVLEGNKDTKSILILENIQYKEDPPPIIHENKLPSIRTNHPPITCPFGDHT